MEDRPQFDSRFELGIEQIDQQHRRLFEIAANVYDSLSNEDASAASATQAAVAKLLNYTATHFATEEALMEAAGFPDLEAHRALHRALIAQARDMEMRLELGEPHMPLELNRFIYTWLVDHIMNRDKRFGEFVAARR